MKRKEFYALGIMSGTSVDGLDFSIIKSDGKEKVQIIENKYFKFSREFKIKIINFIGGCKKKKLQTLEKSYFFKDFNKFYTLYLIKKIKQFFLSCNFKKYKIDLIGIHGNTIIHKPSKNKSIQLVDPHLIFNQFNKPVVFDFRINDISYGGEGAPLVPIFHKSIFSKRGKKIIVVNIGGISNFTFLNGKKGFFASDIGPGNTLIDRFCLKFLKKNYDYNGYLAKKGKINSKSVKLWLNKKEFNINSNKSFDVENFKLEKFTFKNSSFVYDNLRSLTYFTAKLISQVKLKINYKIDYWIFAGGGVKNLTLMNDIRKLLVNEKIIFSDDLGIDSSFLESAAFAYIGIRTLKNLPSAFPETTGCSKGNICGKLITNTN